MSKDYFESLCVVPNPTDSFDEVWFIVNRENGRFVERMVNRLNAVDCGGIRQVLLDEQVFMDSTLSYDEPLSITTLSIGTDLVEVTTAEPHGFASGDIVSLQCTGIDQRYEVLNVNYNTVTNYWPASGMVNGFLSKYSDGYNNGSDEDQSWQSCYNCTITKMVIKLATAPGSQKSRRFTVRKNGADTDLTVDISGSDTTATVTGSISFGSPSNSLDKISIKEQLINGATDSAFSVSLVAQASSDRQVVVSGRRWGTFYNTSFHNPVFNNNAVRWNPGSAGGILTEDAEESGFQSLMSSAGKFKNIRWLCDVVPSPSPSTNYYLMAMGSNHSGGPYSGYYMRINTGVYEQETTSEFTRTAGQYDAFFRNILNFDTITTSNGWHTIDFIPNDSGHRIFNCDFRPQSNVDVYHSGVGMHELGDGGDLVSDLSIEPFSIIPTSGTIKNLYVDTFITPDSGEPFVVTMRKNGADTALTVTISNPATTGNNINDTIAVSAGDYISIKGFTLDNKWGNQVKPKIAWTFVADTVTETPIILTSFGKETAVNTPTTSTRTFLIGADNRQVYTGGGFVRHGANVFEGLEHLEGETVKVLGDGLVLDDEVVVDGSIVLSSEYGLVHVGLGYFSDVALLPIEVNQ